MVQGERKRPLNGWKALGASLLGLVVGTVLVTIIERLPFGKKSEAH